MTTPLPLSGFSTTIVLSLTNLRSVNNSVAEMLDLELLTEEGKFEEVGGDDYFDTVMRLEDKLIRLLRKLKNSGAISDATYSVLVPSGSRLGVLYGLPKAHNPNHPLRPITSAIGTFNHKVAQFLVGISHH